MAEWSNAAVLKTAEPVTVRGFESSYSATILPYPQEYHPHYLQEVVYGFPVFSLAE